MSRPRNLRCRIPAAVCAWAFPTRTRTWLVVMAVVVVANLAGCLEEPQIDEKWTKIEFLSMAPKPGQTSPATQPLQVSVKGRITYRKIQTGYLVAEVRYSDTIAPSGLALDPTQHTLEASEDVDRILANSVTAGRAIRPVTGFDHLMQDIDLAFTAQVPAAMLSPAPGTMQGLYLVLYMGSGEKLRLQGGRDSVVVTPFVSTQHEVLHTGYALSVSP